MSIRSRLNLTVVVMIALFLLAGLTTLRTVSVHAAQTRKFSRVRIASQLTAAVRIRIYQHLASLHADFVSAENPDGAQWPDDTMDVIHEGIELAGNDRERECWSAVRDAVVRLPAVAGAGMTAGEIDRTRQTADVNLRVLQNMHNLRESDLMAQSIRSSLLAQKVVGLASVLSILLFLAYLIMTRQWLLRPVDVLKRSADAIGEGHFDHRVPIYGNDELAQLARRVDAMAAKLARHQEAVTEARELSAVGKMCTNVAHGLRNPLATIRTTAQLRLRRAGDTGDLRHAAEDIMAQVDQMDNRITALLEFGRPVTLARDCTTFRELADAACAEVGTLIQDHRTKLLIDDDTEDAIWCLDRKQMVTALAELISNAVHHSEVGREVIVHSDRMPSRNGQGLRYRIQVRDVGSGMSEATINTAFAPFFSTRPGGTGMGLAIVRQVVERHEGTVEISSTPGKGTTVTMTLHCSCPNPLPENADPKCQARLEALRLRQENSATD